MYNTIGRTKYFGSDKLFYTLDILIVITKINKKKINFFFTISNHVKATESKFLYYLKYFNISKKITVNYLFPAIYGLYINKIINLSIITSNYINNIYNIISTTLLLNQMINSQFIFYIIINKHVNIYKLVFKISEINIKL